MCIIISCYGNTEYTFQWGKLIPHYKSAPKIRQHVTWKDTLLDIAVFDKNAGESAFLELSPVLGNV